MTFTAVYMQVPEGYIAFVEELPGATLKAQRWKKHVKTCARRSLLSWKQIASWPKSHWSARMCCENRSISRPHETAAALGNGVDANCKP